MTSYCYPHLGSMDLLYLRLFGSGLGNILLPWARAVLYANRSGSRMIAPVWFNIKPGAIIRREADPRFYHGLFHSHAEDIVGIRRLKILLTKSREGEVIRIFKGLGNYFTPVLHDHKFILPTLLSITREPHLSGFKTLFGKAIFVHVRLGDFSLSQSSQAFSEGRKKLRIPCAGIVGR